MKIKTLNIYFESMDDFFERIESNLFESVKLKKVNIQKKDHLIWSSAIEYQKFMNDQKYAILSAIRKYQPSSIYELAKIVERAQQNVDRDCRLLESHGFLKFDSPKGKRGSKAPKLSFPYDAIVVHLPKITYSVQFFEAA